MLEESQRCTNVMSYRKLSMANDAVKMLMMTRNQEDHDGVLTKDFAPTSALPTRYESLGSSFVRPFHINTI